MCPVSCVPCVCMCVRAHLWLPLAGETVCVMDTGAESSNDSPLRERRVNVNVVESEEKVATMEPYACA